LSIFVINQHVTMSLHCHKNVFEFSKLILRLCNFLQFYFNSKISQPISCHYVDLNQSRHSVTEPSGARLCTL